MQIYLARNNQQAGPYTLEQLNQMLASQQVLLTDLVWHQGMSEWKTLGELTQGQLFYQPTVHNTPVSSQTTQTTTQQNDQTTHHNPSIQHVSVQKRAKKTEIASLGARFFAKLFDLFLWLPATYILTAFFSSDEKVKFTQINEQFINIALNQNGNAAQLDQLQRQMFEMIPQHAIFAAIAYILIMLAIQAFFIAKSGQSLGKKLAKIQIVDAETGQQVNLLRGFTLRSVIFILLNLITTPFLSIIDFLFALGSKRQTLHDKIAKTIVVKR